MAASLIRSAVRRAVSSCTLKQGAQRSVRAVSSRRAPLSAPQLRAMSFWSNPANPVTMAPRDPILGVSEAFQADPFEGKVSVGVGAYRTDEGKPWVLPSVAEAQLRIVNDPSANMEYLPITGLASFVSAARDLAYGATSPEVTENRVAACQSLSGTGALRLCAELISRHWSLSATEKPKVFVPNPTWGNHFQIFGHAGLEVDTYRYWDPVNLGLDEAGMLEDLAAAPENSVVVLHACAHNPTGVDPTSEQWTKISDVVKSRGHMIVADNAYQGFASGDTDKDIAAVRQLIRDGHKIALCQSFAKNFGLYGQRVGLFSVVCEDDEERARVESQIKIIARAMYSNPSMHGAHLVATILGDEQLKSMWLDEIRVMSGRIHDMRALLRQKLEDAGSARDWSMLTDQTGMFSYTGLSVEQCAQMTEKHHIYLTSNGRISMAGVNTGNVDRLAAAIHDVSK